MDLIVLVLIIVIAWHVTAAVLSWMLAFVIVCLQLFARWWAERLVPERPEPWWWPT